MAPKRNPMMSALGEMVGLVLSLYVFDEVIDVIMPLLYSCNGTTGYIVNSTSLAPAATPICVNATYLNDSHNASGGYFGTALTFIRNLYPVIGILAAFEITVRALKKTNIL